jgi:hypothetical protein
MRLPVPTARLVADAVVALKQARAKTEKMPAGEDRTLATIKFDRATADLARAVQRATAKRTTS